MIINFYKLFLDSALSSFVLNENYTKTLLKIRSSYTKNKDFNKNYRVYSLNIGRRQGASSAIKEYIKQNPELEFLLITTDVMFKSQYEKDLINCKNYSVCHQKNTLIGKILYSDVVIFDDYDLLVSNKNYKELDDLILDKLNDRGKINQIYVKFQ